MVPIDLKIDEEARQFTLAEAHEIRRQHQSGQFTRGEIADCWGASPGTIGRVVTRRGAYANDPEEEE